MRGPMLRAFALRHDPEGAADRALGGTRAGRGVQPVAARPQLVVLHTPSEVKAVGARLARAREAAGLDEVAAVRVLALHAPTHHEGGPAKGELAVPDRRPGAALLGDAGAL